MPAVDVPSRSGKGWFALLSQTTSRVLNKVGQAASRVFHSVWSHLESAWHAVKQFVKSRPKLTAGIAILVSAALLIPPVAKLIANIVGFTSKGTRAGSLATQIQSLFYGGFVPKGSLFSFFQSFGAGPW